MQGFTILFGFNVQFLLLLITAVAAFHVSPLINFYDSMFSYFYTGQDKLIKFNLKS